MSDPLRTEEQFKNTFPLECGTIHVSLDEDDREMAWIRENSGDANRGVLLTVQEARALKDWLTRALP